MSPPAFSLTLRALLTLPYRLCNPPPAAGNVRSCKVTPLIKVSLEDVLNKRHLPPLTLKDFEEWLVFVEGCPQYLYFLLWYKEYEIRYAAWLAESGCEFPTEPSSPKFASTATFTSATVPAGDISDSYINLIPSSAALALFFTRAKQTFLDLAPQSPYALGPDALATLSATNSPSTHSLSPSIHQFTIPPPSDDGNVLPPSLAAHPHPHPRELAPLAQFARDELKERLDRFALGAMQNMGTRRAWCGIAVGTMVMLFIGILPALVALFWAPSRWWRLVGILGCWIGGSFVIASLHGICMMIYIFGDLRQLRSFELARPAISPPRAIARARPRLRSYFTRTPDTSLNVLNVPKPPLRPLLPLRPKVGSRLQHAISETSTGTPFVRFGTGAVELGAVSEGSTITKPVLGSGTEIDSGYEKVLAKEDHCGYGIEISPAYYPEEMGTSGMAAGERVQKDRQYSAFRNGLESVRSGVEHIFTWVFGSAPGEMGTDGMYGNSDAGTFGVRGGFGSLSGDVEKNEVLSATETDAEVLTAEFIPREDVEPKETPVQFDFNKLPPRMSISSSSRPVSLVAAPCTVQVPRPHSHPSSHLPNAKMFFPPPPLQPVLPLYSHPGARLSDSLARASFPSSTTPPIPFPLPRTAAHKTRQWWDKCPQHPDVEAFLASRSSTLTHAAGAAATMTATMTSSASSMHSRVRALDQGDEAAEAAAPLAWRARLRRVLDVPVFGPLTRVLSPVATRGQWEIVVRSVAAAALVAWMVIGCVVALPEMR